MDQAPTGDLKTLLAQHGPLDAARAVDVVRQVAAAVDATHANQTVHRNITASAILLAGDGSVYLSDTSGTTPSTDRTRVLVTDSEATYRADIYALAQVLYECLTGHPPDPGGPVLLPSRQRPGIPAGFDAVIARALAADPDDRYRTAAELVAAAQGALAEKPARPSQATTRSFELPQPVGPGPQAPQWDPIQGRSPTVSYPHSRPVQLAPPRRRRIGPLVAALVIVAAVVAGAIAIPRLAHRSGPAAPATSTAPPRRTYTAQPTVLPFPGLYPTKSVAVDGAGNVYVLAAVVPAADAGPFESEPAKLWKLASGAGAAIPLDVTGANFRSATDLAVDKAGNIYYSDQAQVYLLESGKTSPIRLPFRGFSSITAVAVDQAGNTYAAGALLNDGLDLKYGAKKLAPGENRPTDLSFQNLFLPRGIAVDKDGNVYMSSAVKGSGRGQVLKLAVGATNPVALGIPGLIEPNHIAIDSAGDIFVGDGFGKGFFQLHPTGRPVEVPLGSHTSGVAVDSEGTVYALTSARSDRSDKIVQPGQVLRIAPDR